MKNLIVACPPAWFIIFLLTILLTGLSCNQPEPGIISMQNHLDSLELKLTKGYKPGLGEYMLNIQVHHAKLWFAGQAENWPLADFESKEIQETIDDIQSYCADRPEVVSISMIKPPLDAVGNAINKRNLSEFKSGFFLLTNTCNNCHRITKHSFNVIQIPEIPPFSNQNYKPVSK